MLRQEFPTDSYLNICRYDYLCIMESWNGWRTHSESAFST